MQSLREKVTKESVITENDDQNRVLSVVQISEGENRNRTQSLAPNSLLTAIQSSVRASAVILHQDRVQQMSSLTDSYPLACLPIANKPVLSHQIKYLEANGLFDIYVVIHKEFQVKVEKFLKEHSDLDPRTSVYLVVIREETESANALKLIGQLQISQE